MDLDYGFFGAAKDSRTVMIQGVRTKAWPTLTGGFLFQAAIVHTEKPRWHIIDLS